MIKTEKEVVEHFKKYQNDLYELDIMFKDLVKKQRYALAKLYMNQIDVLKYLRKFDDENSKT